MNAPTLPPSKERVPGPKQPPRLHGEGCICGDYSRQDCPVRDRKPPAPASNSLNIDVQDKSTATPLQKLRRFLMHLAGHDASPYFYADGFPRVTLNHDAAEFVKLVDAISRSTHEPRNVRCPACNTEFSHAAE
jgi:hypothetical protein